MSHFRVTNTLLNTKERVSATCTLLFNTSKAESKVSHPIFNFASDRQRSFPFKSFSFSHNSGTMKVVVGGSNEHCCLYRQVAFKAKDSVLWAQWLHKTQKAWVARTHTFVWMKLRSQCLRIMTTEPITQCVLTGNLWKTASGNIDADPPHATNILSEELMWVLEDLGRIVQCPPGCTVYYCRVKQAKNIITWGLKVQEVLCSTMYWKKRLIMDMSGCFVAKSVIVSVPKLYFARWSSKMGRTCPWSVWYDTWTLLNTLHLNIYGSVFSGTRDLDCNITFDDLQHFSFENPSNNTFPHWWSLIWPCALSVFFFFFVGNFVQHVI